MANLSLKKFDISLVSNDKVVVLLGKRNTGKSFLIKDMLYHNKNVPIASVMSSTEGANKFYSNIIPPLLIHDEFNEEIVEKLLRRQKKLRKKLEAQIKNHSYSNINPHAFLIMDDLMDSAKTWVKNKNVKNVFLNGRHYFLIFILAMQFPLGIPPELRTNIDYVFILRDNLISNRKRIWEHYAGCFPTFDLFNSVMDQCTEDYHCLVIDNSSKSNKLEDIVYWYKAEPHQDFKIGSKELWKINDKYYDSSDDLDSEEQKFTGKIKKNKLRIKKIK